MSESPKRAARRRWVSSSLVTRSVFTFLEDRRSEEGAVSAGAVDSSVDEWWAALSDPVDDDVVDSLATLEGERNDAVVVSLSE